MPRRKKQKLEDKKPQGLQELEGFKMGDHIWCKYFTGKLMEGKIVEFSHTEKYGGVITFVTTTQGYRTAHIDMCSHNKEDAKKLPTRGFL